VNFRPIQCWLGTQPPTSVFYNVSADPRAPEAMELNPDKISIKFLRGCGVIEISGSDLKWQKLRWQLHCPLGPHLAFAHRLQLCSGTPKILAHQICPHNSPATLFWYAKDSGTLSLPVQFPSNFILVRQRFWYTKFTRTIPPATLFWYAKESGTLNLPVQFPSNFILVRQNLPVVP
jgi:hypothetical protein